MQGIIILLKFPMGRRNRLEKAVGRKWTNTPLVPIVFRPHRSLCFTKHASVSSCAARVSFVCHYTLFQSHAVPTACSNTCACCDDHGLEFNECYCPAYLMLKGKSTRAQTQQCCPQQRRGQPTALAAHHPPQDIKDIKETVHVRPKGAHTRADLSPIAVD